MGDYFMSVIEYARLGEVDAGDFVPLLNSQKTRAHLIEHEPFDEDSVRVWINTKVKMDGLEGCRVRAVLIQNKPIGWCGIQLEEGKYEIAIVIDHKYWGLGRRIFNDMMRWAKDLGHEEVFIHFLHTRPDYKFLRKIATQVYESELLGNKFTSYRLAVK